MKNWKKILVLLTIILSVAFAADAMKIGFIYSEQIMQEYQEAIDAMKKLEAEAVELQNVYKEMQADYQRLIEDYEKRKLVSSDAWKNNKQKEIITSCCVTTGVVNEAHVLEKTIADHKDAVGKTVKTVVADSKYGTKENYQALKARGVKTHIKDLGASRAAGAAVFGKDRFTYVAERDVYVCPAGKELQRRSWNRNRQWMKYRIDKEHCASCELRSQCTNDKNGRSLNRTPGDDLIAAGRQDASSKEGVTDLKKRQHLMERSYAYGKRFGFKRARWRSMWRVSIQQLLVATVQNLLKITKYEDLARGSYMSLLCLFKKSEITLDFSAFQNI